MNNLLAIDFGTSKTAALWLDCQGPNILKAEEFVFGNNQIVNKNNFNLLNWQNSLEQVLKRLNNKKHLRKAEIVISLPEIIFTPEQKNTPQGNINLAKDYKKAEIFAKINKVFKQNKMRLPNIFYPLPFYQKYAEVENFILLNLGGRFSQLLIYKNRQLQKNELIPVGGEQVIHDIAVVLQVSENEARECFFNFGKLFESVFNSSEDLLTKIIDERLKELFVLIKQRLDASTETIYLFGGLANCPKLPQYLESYLKTKIVSLNDKLGRSFLFEQAYLLAENYLKLK